MRRAALYDRSSSLCIFILIKHVELTSCGISRAWNFPSAGRSLLLYPHIVLHTTDLPHHPPHAFEMASSREVDIPTYDGLKLKGTLFTAGEKKPCVIMSSGVSQNR